MNAEDFEAFMEGQKRINRVRKQDKPGWPTHKQTVLFPDGERLVSETVPIKRLRKSYYCKYCYTRHSNWWLMDTNDYNIPGGDDAQEIILCGECEHTSCSDLAE